jgi:hypothetical protein
VKDQSGSADTGDNILPITGMMLFSAAAVVLIVAGKKKGWWAR